MTFVLHSITESTLPSVVGGLVGVLIGVAMINVARFLGYFLFKWSYHPYLNYSESRKIQV